MEQHALTTDQFPRITKYDLRKELGHGGMATVYLAHDRRLGREVAVKVIHRHLRDSGEVARRFTSEARAVAKLKHPNIVEIYDVSEEDAPERYLVAELVRGRSLRAQLTERPTMPPEVAACLGVELAAALAHAHERGVIHRDVKPENVLFSLPWAEVSGDEPSEPSLVGVKLTDFGIAKLLDQQGVTSTGQVLGSPAYMAPEQIDGDAVDVRADVFALGVLIYECMVGRLPFDGKTPGQILKAILQGQYTPADQVRPEVGVRWSRLVQQALAPDPAQRFSSMATLRAALEAELHELGIQQPRVELTAYLRDPDGYEIELARRLVPLLRQQGQRALRKRERMRAAESINRAASLAPGDPEVMAMVRLLLRADGVERWRQRALIGAGTLVVALVAGGVGWRALRPPPRVRARTLPAMSVAIPSASASAPDAPAAVSIGPIASSELVPPVASSAGGHRLASPSVGPRPSADAVKGEKRLVAITLFPPSALWKLDGQPIEPGAPALLLTVGSTHHVEGTTLPTNHCCESPYHHEITVQAGEGEQQVNVPMPFRPALVRSSGPSGTFFSCPALWQGSRLPANGSQSVSVNRLTVRANCTLFDNGHENTQQIVLHPGETTELRWGN